jgi:enediyne biosynthesis protein E4
METNRDRCLRDFVAARSDRRSLRCSIGFIALFLGLASLGELPWGGGEPRKPVRPLAPSRVESQVERSPAGVSFVDVAKDAGLGGAVVVGGGVQNKRYILEVMGGGVAFLDYDSDGWPDIFLVNATTLEGFPQGKEPSNYLFHNNHDETFTDVTTKASLIHSGWGQGACVGDYNNDGLEDLFVTYWDSNILYRNNGDGTFTDVTQQAGLSGTKGRWSTGCTFFDYNRDSHLDLFVSNYITFDPSVAPLPGANYYCSFMTVPVACGPEGLGGGTNILYYNRGEGTFEDVSEKSGVANPRGTKTLTLATDRTWRPVGSYGFTAIAADFDNDGWPDIYVSCDTTPSLLYHNNRDGTFSDVGIPAGCALNGQGVAQGGMGAAATDYDGDGWFDIVRANFAGDPTTLYRNNGDGSFTDVSQQAGLGAITKYVGMGVGFLDFNNDSWKDIFVANGHVYPEADRIPGIAGFKQPNVLFRNLGNGRFADVSSVAGPGLKVVGSSHGCAFADYDNDGDIDILVSNNNQPPNLLRNDGGNKHNWLIVKCLGRRSNRIAIGTRVRTVTGPHAQMEEVISGSSFLSQSDLRLHFGLGQAKTVDVVEVTWPSGAKESFPDVQANQLITIEEGRGIVKAQTFRPLSRNSKPADATQSK